MFRLKKLKNFSLISFSLREILWDISQGNHRERLCKENCEQNGRLFSANYTPYHCQYSIEHPQIHTVTDPIPSRIFKEYHSSKKIKALLHKKTFELEASSSPSQRVWNKSKLEDQELVKFDLLAAQFKAMEIEVQEGRRTLEDLEPLKIELDKM